VYIATEGPLGFSALNQARALGIPVYSGFHTNFHAYSRFYRLGWLERLVLAWLRYFHNRTEGTLVPTRKQAQWLSDHGFRNVAVLRRGVNLERFSPDRRCDTLRAQWGADSETPVVLYVGRLAAEKNIDLVLQAYHALRQRMGRLCFVLVGDGPLASSLRESCHGHDDIHFMGQKTGDELAACYASADIFVFPSQTDTFGNVVTEAMASRLAIVSFRDAAARELLKHERSALLVELDQEPQFIESVERLLTDRVLRERIRESAWQLTRELSWSGVVARFIHTLSGRPEVLAEEEFYGRV
jgi:glycosyltransferase involved in cell wall biosynthesis